ncbi:hypothetical protein BLD44_028495 [Mastigocladus laminosus UU774]|nr:hypothetical protein BLD44_028495 [Mastigocladus laminosus UU774]
MDMDIAEMLAMTDDPYIYQKRYLRTEKGKEAKRRTEARRRLRAKEQIAEYNNSEERKEAKRLWARKSRQRASAVKFIYLLVVVYSMELTNTLCKYLLDLVRDRRYSLPIITK